MAVEVCVLVGEKGVVIAFGVDIGVSGVVYGDKSFLLLGLADVLDGIATPDLSLLHNSAWRNHTVRSNDGALLQDCPFQNN